MRPIKTINAVLLLLLCNIGFAVAQQRNSLIIAEDHLILQIDLKSSEKVLDSLFKVAGVSTSNTEKVVKGDFLGMANEGWIMSGHENNLVRFDRSLSDLNENPQSRPYLVTTRVPQIDGRPGYPDKAQYGFNKYAKITVYQLPSGFIRFILPGYPKAKRVFLSGNFNNWSTLKGAMKKTDGGWLIDVSLEAGAYEYKYIVDGHWMTDPNNLLQMDDGIGNVNSVFFKYNYVFKLSGYPLAHRITVAGDFNKWNANELIMEKKGNTWEREMYLSDGIHDYRFMADGKWITDPGNPTKVQDEDGNINSVLNLGEIVTFKLKGYTDARQVFVAGDFNNWHPNEISLKKTIDSWVLQYVLTGGNYDYKFIVDGKWITDPDNPYYVFEGGQKNSFLSVKPNYTFKLKGFDNAKTVTLTGTFNDWDPQGCIMAHKGDEWIIPFNLKPGKTLYKFRIDGRWIIDPGNRLWEQNQFNTGNSVLWIE